MSYTLNSILKKSASAFAAHIAVEDLNGHSITYARLYQDSVSVSRFLTANGVAAGMRVGIAAPKSTAYVACLFGIMQCHAAYVPLDINAPLARTKVVINDCGLKAIFIDDSMVETYKPLFAQSTYKLIPFRDNFSMLLFKADAVLHEQELAYILYTSGSTGVPKGVMHTHESAGAFIKWCTRLFKPRAADKFASHAPFHFDLSVFDVFVPLSVGASLLLFDEKTSTNPLLLVSTLAQKKISFFYATPTTLTYLYNYGKPARHDMSSLTKVLFAGEVFPVEDLRAVKSVLPEATFYNLYGPTETNVCSYYKIPARIPARQINPFPIGKACSFAELKTDAAPGKKGELLVAGKSLMSGYWNDGQKTKAAFKKDETGKQWYKTGDIVYLDIKNQYVYVGRKDRMVKRRGYRIELGEIEAILNSHKAILQAAVLAGSVNSQTDTVITAHIAFKPGAVIPELELHGFCRNLLPIYMIPDRFKFHEKLPSTSTHKIDYKTLSSLYE